MSRPAHLVPERFGTPQQVEVLSALEPAVRRETEAHKARRRLWFPNDLMSADADGPATPDARSAQLREILKLAQQHHGELSLMAAAAGTTLSLEACRTYLEELVTEGMAQMSVEDDGVILYRFPDFMHALPEPEHRAELNLFSLQKKLRSVSSCPQPPFFNT